MSDPRELCFDCDEEITRIQAQPLPPCSLCGSASDADGRRAYADSFITCADLGLCRLRQLERMSKPSPACDVCGHQEELRPSGDGWLCVDFAACNLRPQIHPDPKEGTLPAVVANAKPLELKFNGQEYSLEEACALAKSMRSHRDNLEVVMERLRKERSDVAEKVAALDLLIIKAINTARGTCDQ
jgi:hypothetical protein